MEKYSVSRLIGAPPGYVGYDQGGQLTEVVRRRPYSVILFDEIEKAHPDVFNILLQVLDDGRLTDGQGRVVDFTNTIIIMTSNLGSQEILADPQHAEEHVMEIIRHTFKPEFINRIDEIVMFNPLGAAEIRKIVHLQLETLKERVLRRGYHLEWDESVEAHIAQAGFDPAFGARPIRRCIQNEVEICVMNCDATLILMMSTEKSPAEKSGKKGTASPSAANHLYTKKSDDVGPKTTVSKICGMAVKQHMTETTRTAAILINAHLSTSRWSQNVIPVSSADCLSGLFPVGFL